MLEQKTTSRNFPPLSKNGYTVASLSSLEVTSSKIPAPFMENSVTMLELYCTLRLSCTLFSVARSSAEHRYSCSRCDQDRRGGGQSLTQEESRISARTGVTIAYDVFFSPMFSLPFTTVFTSWGRFVVFGLRYKIYITQDSGVFRGKARNQRTDHTFSPSLGQGVRFQQEHDAE